MCPATETSWDGSRAVRRRPAHSSSTSRGALDAGWPLADQHAPPAVDPGRQASLLPRVRPDGAAGHRVLHLALRAGEATRADRKRTSLNSSHSYNSHDVFCLQKKNYVNNTNQMT